MNKESISYFLDQVRILDELCLAKKEEIDPDDEDLEYLLRCQQKCQEIKQNTEETLTNNSEILYQCLKNHTQAVLDLTFIDENQLAEEEFPESSACEKIEYIFDMLNKAVDLVKKLFPDEEVVHVLGSEIYECIFWRKGALLYMYCHNTQENDERLRKNIEKFKQRAEEGIKYLDALLKLRTPFKESLDKVETNNEDTYNLLQAGLFSDIHVLSLMYIGELCYWYDKAANENILEAESSQKKYINSRGVEALNAYISAVKGPLSGKAWNSSRAEELIGHLNSVK